MVQGQLFTSETRSQESAILEYLKSGKSLTQLEALSRFRCLRLGARVFGLKKQGYNIESEMVTVASGKRVAQYKLKEQSNETS